ncbi:MAG: hypothetical protein JO332_07580 [Planctomycetaceae bacterium]|nr:hypothetical protein [Planctomycetaceae bacterium]
MTYRPPLGQRWKYPFLLCLAVAAIWVAAWLLLHPRGRRPGLEFYLLGGSLVAFGTLIRESWRTWTTRVDIDDAGLRWAKGFESGSMRWEEISELGHSYGRGRRTLLVGPVRARSWMLHPLPLLPPRLYEEIKRRIGGLPPDVERDFLQRAGR